MLAGALFQGLRALSNPVDLSIRQLAINNCLGLFFFLKVCQASSLSKIVSVVATQSLSLSLFFTFSLSICLRQLNLELLALFVVSYPFTFELNPFRYPSGSTSKQ